MDLTTSQEDYCFGGYFSRIFLTASPMRAARFSVPEVRLDLRFADAPPHRLTVRAQVEHEGALLNELEGLRARCKRRHAPLGGRRQELAHRLRRRTNRQEQVVGQDEDRACPSPRREPMARHLGVDGLEDVRLGQPLDGLGIVFRRAGHHDMSLAAGVPRPRMCLLEIERLFEIGAHLDRSGDGLNGEGRAKGDGKEGQSKSERACHVSVSRNRRATLERLPAESTKVPLTTYRESTVEA